MLNAAKSVARRAATELSQFPSWTLLRTKHIPELELTALLLQHDKTGAEHLHISREDSNNVFSIGFKTNPPDDTGVPHILEHTTLCGSERYPIRDPFFKMLPRSLSNFMNAYTASDHTFYPFATTNSQDFKNLMSVYLDATLRPLLKESDFGQEGWRIGPENPQAEDGKLVFKGVVYNEMKGQMSDAGYLFCIRFQDHMFPDINNSGGDPQKITDLTYEQLRKYHAAHYHPSNAKILTYGDMPLSDHLREIDIRLRPFEKIQRDLKIHGPVDLTDASREVTVAGPVDPLVDANRQFKSSVSWVLGDANDIVESFSMALITDLLMDGYGSPLYRGLIETGLGIDWSPNAGYDGSGKFGILSIGLSGLEEADVPRLKTEIQTILGCTRARGFDRSKIDGYLHQVELGFKHKTANFGMSLVHRLKAKWFIGVDPFDYLAWNDTIAAFRAKLEGGGYLEGLMDRYLLNNNNNTFSFTMSPSATYEQDLAREEASRLTGKIAEAAQTAGGLEQARVKFQQQELNLLVEQGKSQTEDLSCLPTVYVKDIARQKQPIAVHEEDTAHGTIQWREAPTNGLTYFRAINTLENLPDELRSLIPLFTDAVMRRGTKDMSVEQLEDAIKLKTGGVSVGYHSAPLPSDFTRAKEGLVFTGMALDRHVPAMFDLVHKLVLETNFESTEAVQHIRQLLQASADGVVNDIASSGHTYARRAAEAGLSWNSFLEEQVSGLSQVKLVTLLANRPESDRLEDVISKLKQIQRIALAGNIRSALTCDSGSVHSNSTALSRFLSCLPSKPTALSEFLSSLPRKLAGFPNRPSLDLSRNLKTFYPLPYQVYYGGLALPTVSYTSPDGAPLDILSRLLTHKHLHHEIREKGGAYGGGAYSRSLEGVFGFYSYRDPNPVNTMKIMQNAGRWAVDKEWTDTDLEEAKISVFQGVDAPQSVHEEGMGRFLYGISDDMRQQRRERLLDVTKDQVREVAQKYVVDAMAQDSGCLVFLGEKRDWVDNTWKVTEMDIGDRSAPPVDS